MIGNYRVVTLCGSTRFKDTFTTIQRELTLKGYIVISLGMFDNINDDQNLVGTDKIRLMLSDMHKRKIDMADEIFVVNVNGYIGDSTANEINYARKVGKEIRYLVNIND